MARNIADRVLDEHWEFAVPVKFMYQRLKSDGLVS